MLRFAVFPFFSIWFSVFGQNTSGFSDLISDVVFGFSYLVSGNAPQLRRWSHLSANAWDLLTLH